MTTDNVMNALFGPMGTAVFLGWVDVAFKLVTVLCGVFVFMAVNERSNKWRDDALRLWQEAAPEDGGPNRGPSTLNAKALAKTVGVEFEGTDDPDLDEFLVPMILSKQFEDESNRIIRDAQERLKRFKRAPENRSRLREARGDRLLYVVSQIVLTVAGCILVTSFVWADFAWQGAAAASVARGGSDLGWEDYTAYAKIVWERRLETSCSPANCAREGACPFVCKGWSPQH
jgi:hypothetical protein